MVLTRQLDDETVDQPYYRGLNLVLFSSFFFASSFYYGASTVVGASLSHSICTTVNRYYPNKLYDTSMIMANICDKRSKDQLMNKAL